MTAVFGYAAMIALGLVLGLIGAGGSILTVPILVYLFAVSPSQATGYSLVIVGTAAAAGGLEYLRRGQSSPRMALIFGVPAIVGVYLTRRYVFPAVPDPVLEISSWTVSKDLLVMLVFAAFMLAASFAMIRGGAAKLEPSGAERWEANSSSALMLILLGFVVGTFTGFVGAGGGFMILPVLVLLGGLPIRVAIGTDLLIIAAKSLIGFLGELQAAPGALDLRFVAMLVLLPLIGIAAGSQLNRFVPAPLLKRGFGWFVLVMAVYVITRELAFS